MCEVVGGGMKNKKILELEKSLCRSLIPRDSLRFYTILEPTTKI